MQTDELDELKRRLDQLDSFFLMAAPVLYVVTRSLAENNNIVNTQLTCWCRALCDGLMDAFDEPAADKTPTAEAVRQLMQALRRSVLVLHK